MISSAFDTIYDDDHDDDVMILMMTSPPMMLVVMAMMERCDSYPVYCRQIGTIPLII